MKNIKLIIEYDGTNYVGWQKQKNGLSVSEVIEKAIYEVTKQNVELIGSGRTDAGVHARGQVANFLIDTKIQPERLKDAINSKLPTDITIVKSIEVDREFHSRYNSKGKWYSYTIFNRLEPSPFYNKYSAHIKYNLDLDKMKSAAQYLIGTHDFAAFRSEGSSVKTTVRTIYSIDIIKNGDIIRLDFKGDGFLYNMVRIITGTLIDVGRGKKSTMDIPKILESKDRRLAGFTAPACGLCLEEVYY
ncbi:MAG: tRNA pseudouridine(38-40) synthase TruA [Caloramator sp.]|jgi:tRNA pseudouridine38-40 synthase|uniref:tRNA pseudouridine(38-40) synthase TruA n=1 Tax=Caloramator sp. TaxID=1871330 RepID=UPI001D4A8C72|nr:tRNA pseudouridine(38-40) synthase TruA [Caloramator sp.]MBZ4663324.1 tRNA pseudouridine(38-40) synthase TruA [Caloramator sp.]